MQTPLWLEIIKAILGPLATIVAAGAATFITYRLGRYQLDIAAAQAKTSDAQREIAQSQRDIAYDKLKHDLFDKRYEVYLTAKAMIEAVSKQNFVEGPGDPQFREMRVKLSEARFFFPAESVALFEKITNLATAHEVARASLALNRENQEFRTKQGDIAAKAVSELANIYGELPSLMEKELGFAQLRDQSR
jgi:hypothetical protein